MVAGYIVSAKNDGVAAGQLRRRISSFASVNGEEIGHWMESGSLTHDYANAITLLNSLKSGDALYVNDVASLASTFKELVTVLSEAVRRGIRLYGVNDGYTNSKIECSWADFDAFSFKTRSFSLPHVRLSAFFIQMRSFANLHGTS